MLLHFGIALVLFSVLSAVHSIPPFLRKNNIFANRKILPNSNNLNYRLPNHTIPEAYSVELTTNVHSGLRDFSGIVQIDLKVIETTSTITINARQLNHFVANIIRTDLTTSTTQPLSVVYVAETEFLHLSQAELQFPKDSKWRLTINYEGKLRADDAGFYMTSFKDKVGQTCYLATTQFEETDARHAFPCYDEPAKRADFTIKINHDPSYSAISNMPIDTEKSTLGHTVFQILKSCSTYLVAFTVSDFTYSTAELDKLPQHVYSRTGTEADRELALQTGMLTMNRLQSYSGVDFPLRKIDMVAIPNFLAGGMENWGLILYREESLLYNAKTSTIISQQQVASTIAHENAHQWFGDFVAMKWWTYLWMKEGFATYFEIELIDKTYPEWDYKQEGFVSNYLPTLSSDSTPNAHPMTYYVETTEQISTIFDYVPYIKAASVLSMFQNALTDTVFQKGIHYYLDINKYSATDEDDLFSALQMAVDEEKFALAASVKEIMSSWTCQSNYPLLTVTRDYEKATFEVAQEAYFTSKSHTSNKTWYIPFNFVTQLNPDFRQTLATHYINKNVTMNVEDVNISNEHWLILNKQSTGLYRVNYDLHNWNLITEQLLQKHYKIHTLNRAQLLFDAYTFSTSSRLNYNVLLKMMTYLSEEDQYAPWHVAVLPIENFNYFLKSHHKYDNFKKFMAKLSEKPYEKLGAYDVPGQPHLQPLVRSIVVNLACLAGVESCLKELTKKLANSIFKNIPIEPNMRDVTYCNGLKQADDQTFNGVYNLLMKSTDPVFRDILIKGLGCSESSTQLKQFFESSLDKSNQLKTEERINLLFPAISSSMVGIDQSIDFLQNHWDEYAALTSNGRNAENVLITISYYAANEFQLDKVKNLLNTVRSKLSSAEIETTVLDNIDYGFRWMNRVGEPIMEWVATYLDPLEKSSASKLTSFNLMALIVLFFVIYFNKF